jgi:TonB family protein
MVAPPVALAEIIPQEGQVAPSETEEQLEAEPMAVSVALPPPTDGSTLPVPKANPGLWLSTPDYPAAALAELRSGRTSFRLEVDKTGRPLNCTVIVSSGHQDLDDAACDAVTRRAIFEPATDKKGRKVKGFYQNSVSWRIPSSIDLPKSGQFTMAYVVDRDGSVSDCKFDTNIETPPNFDVCDKAPTFEPRRDEKGNPVRVRVVTSTVTKIYKLPPKLTAELAEAAEKP